MIDTRAFVDDAMRPWDFGRCNCTSSVAAAVPSCARAFRIWLAQPVTTRRRQAKSPDVLTQAERFARLAGCSESTGPDGWGVIDVNGRELIAAKAAGRWLFRTWPRGVLVFANPIVLRQWGSD